MQEELFVDKDGKAIPGNEEFIKQSNDLIFKSLSKVAALNKGNALISGVENASQVSIKLGKICGPSTATKFAEIFEV